MCTWWPVESFHWKRLYEFFPHLSQGSPWQFAQCDAFWSILFLAVQNSSLHIKLTPTILQLCSQFFKTKMAIWDIENILMEFTFNFYPSNPKPICPLLTYQLKTKIARANTLLTCKKWIKVLNIEI